MEDVRLSQFCVDIVHVVEWNRIFSSQLSAVLQNHIGQELVRVVVEMRIDGLGLLVVTYLVGCCCCIVVVAVGGDDLMMIDIAVVVDCYWYIVVVIVEDPYCYCDVEIMLMMTMRYIVGGCVKTVVVVAADIVEMVGYIVVVLLTRTAEEASQKQSKTQWFL